MLTRLLPLVLAWLAFLTPATANPVISEFMASNSSTLTDEDGDYSDWIEIHNPTGAAINLNGWRLTDDATNLAKWTFPATTLPSGGHIVVFASNKDRRVPGQQLHTNFALSASGEYLALVAPNGITIGTEFAPTYPPQLSNISYGTATPEKWVNLIEQGSPVRYTIPTENVSNWRSVSHNDSAWSSGTLGVGFDNNKSGGVDINEFIGANVIAMQNNGTSVYVRIPFQVPAIAEIKKLELHMRYDDGYVAYLNTANAGGTATGYQQNNAANAARIDQSNSPSTTPVWDTAANGTVGEDPAERTVDVSSAISRLVSGSNILAIHGLNVNAPSSDLLILPTLRALVPDGTATGTVGYMRTPTPGAENSGNNAILLREAVSFSVPTKTFTDNFAVELTGAGSGQTIRYTTNNTDPAETSPLYTGPITITGTTLIRAKIFDPATGASGNATAVFYTKLDADLAGRQSNLPMVVLDARGQGMDGSNRRAGYFMLFDKAGPGGVSSLADLPTIATRQGIRHRGSSSEGFAKKPYSVEFWTDGTDGKNNPLPVLGMPAEQDWIFYSNYYYDRTATRNAVAFEISRRLGRWAPATRFVEVYFNSDGGNLGANDYAGVYNIIEQIKMTPERIGESLVGKNAVPPSGSIDVNATGPWTGGYLFKIDRADDDEYNWTPTNGNELVLHRPKQEDLDGGPYYDDNAVTNNSRQIQYLRAYVQAFDTALKNDADGGFSTRNYLSYIDRDSFIDHLIINVFSQNCDGLRLSSFFYKAENKPIVAGPAWDFDRSMDSADDRDNVWNSWPNVGGDGGTGYFTNFSGVTWWQRLARDPDFIQAFYDRWAFLRQGILSDANIAAIVNGFGDEIDNTANGLPSAAVLDASRWGSATSSRYGNYAGETQHLREWLTNRATWMDRRSTSAALLPASPAITVNNGTATITAATGTIYYTLDGADPRASGGAVGGQAYSAPLSTTGATAVIARVRVGSEWSTPAIVSFATNPPPTVATFVPGVTEKWDKNDTKNWDTGVYPNSPDATAIIGPPVPETTPPAADYKGRNVELGHKSNPNGVNITVGHIQFLQGDTPWRNRIREDDPVAKPSTITFAATDGPASITITGTGVGYVEFELIAGVVLQSTLRLNVANIIGNEEYGSLRLQEKWSGPGGLIKSGLGVATVSGAAVDGSNNKLYIGPTLIEEGVLQVTANAVMANTPSITVQDGGQLRLVSDQGTDSEPRIYTFGGDIYLAGSGRGPEIPDASAQGKAGALRYEPRVGKSDNDNNWHVILTNNIIFTDDAGIHVAGATNRLYLSGSLSGTGSFKKSGGGTLFILGESHDYEASILVDNGTLNLRANLDSDIEVVQPSDDFSANILDAAGATGALTGNGTLLLPATALRAPHVTGLNHDLLFTKTGAPSLANSGDSGNALLITSNLAAPQSIDLYLDLPSAPAADTVIQGGYLLPASADWSPVLNHPALRVFVADASGPFIFREKSWKLTTAAILTTAPVSLASPNGTVSGRILELRFDGVPRSYAAWRAAVFSSGEAANDAIASPEVSAAGDGISNLMRFALGVGPYESAADRLPRLTASGNQASFSFPYDPSLQGLRWVVETSPDLVNWDASGVVFDSQSDSAAPDGSGWLHIDDTSTDTRRFYRLRVTQE